MRFLDQGLIIRLLGLIAAGIGVAALFNDNYLTAVLAGFALLALAIVAGLPERKKR